MSRFVPGGTVDEPIERDDEWAKAQQELEEERRKREEAKEQAGGKSLFEILEANKAAKQEAFEEANRFKNQFRALDDEEVEFLDAVLDSERAKEAAIRKETREQLDSFRKQQEEAEKAALVEDDIAVPEEEQLFAVGRKRKKGKEKESLRGVKLRKSSSSASAAKPQIEKIEEKVASSTSVEQSKPKASSPAGGDKGKASALGASPSASPPVQPRKPSVLGLANYSSDEDD